MKYLQIFLFLALPASLSAQTTPYFYFSKTWNFIKYYHPDLASGKVNADSLFLAKVEKVNAQQTPSEVIEMLLDGLSKNTPVQVFQNKDNKLLSKNQDFGWYKKSIIPEKLRRRLDTIFLKRFVDTTHFYLTKEEWEGDLPNEKSYPYKKDENIPLPFRLLTFAKIQGVIDYLYPYKYLMDSGFEQFEQEQLAQLIDCKTRKDFETILAKFAASLEDTHAFRFYEQLSYKKDILHGKVYPPFDYKVRENYILVTKIISSTLCEKAGIAVGDRIVTVNHQQVKDLIFEKSKLLSTSNRETLLYRLSNYGANIVWNSDSTSQTVTVVSDKGRRHLNLPFIPLSDKTQVALINNFLQAKSSVNNNYETSQDFAYFKINDIFKLIEKVKEDEVDAEMEKIILAAARKKAIVFDMRGYPDWGGLIHTYIYKYFGVKENFYHQIYFPNSDNVGTWAYRTEAKHYFPDIPNKTTRVYNGQVFILVNPETLSAAELYTMNLQYIFPKAITIGQQTAGADGNVKKMALPGGYLLSFTGLGVFYPNGKLTQKVGLKIDQRIQYNDQDVLSGKDNEMEKVTNWLKTH